jgi:hypothetical protein
MRVTLVFSMLSRLDCDTSCFGMLDRSASMHYRTTLPYHHVEKCMKRSPGTVACTTTALILQRVDLAPTVDLEVDDMHRELKKYNINRAPTSTPDVALPHPTGNPASLRQLERLCAVFSRIQYPVWDVGEYNARSSAPAVNAKTGKLWLELRRCRLVIRHPRSPPPNCCALV